MNNPEPEAGRGKHPAYLYWKRQAETRQRIIIKQNKTIAYLTASVVSLEDDLARVAAAPIPPTP